MGDRVGISESTAIRRAADRGQRVAVVPEEWLTDTYGVRLYRWQWRKIWLRADDSGVGASQVVRELLCRVLAAPSSADGVTAALQPPPPGACFTREQRQACAARQPRDARGRFVRRAQ